MRWFQKVGADFGSLLAIVALGCGGSDGGNVQPPGGATTIAENAGNNGHGPAGGVVSPAPSVKVTDAGANPVAGSVVVFAVASGGGSVTGANQTTDQAGIATVGSWTLGAAAGPNTLSASATGLDGSPVTFTAMGEAMVITGVNPASGPLAGGTSLTITGTSFVNVSQVTIGGNALGSLTVVSPTQITGVAPASTTAGAKDVVVTSSTQGTITCSGCFSYLENSPLAGLVTGSRHTCGLTSSGTAYCWGWNYFGQLGNGRFEPSSVGVPVSGGLTFSALTAGASHTCGLTPSGAAYCWGANDLGQLGNGTTDSSAVPVPVSGGLSFSALTAGGSGVYTRYGHTCGITADGTAYCWGYNEAGQLGDGSINSSSVPVAVLGGLKFAQLVGGEFRTCGLTADGVAYCWGWAEAGQLGNGSNDNTSVPVAVSGGLTFSTLGAGSEHNCGITRAGPTYCWGWNDFGQLGDGSNVSYFTPVRVAGGLRFSKLSVGAGFSCALTQAGAAYCWGHNAYGQLGDGSTTYTSAPGPVAGGLTFSALSSGWWHSCGRTTGTAVYCWGYNEFGQLGNGSTAESHVPVPTTQQAGLATAASTEQSQRVCGLDEIRCSPPVRSSSSRSPNHRTGNPEFAR
jgi:alpha-tubulin suppressor-like RCC1 family protein